MIGTNDMFWDNGLSTGPGRLSALIDQITDQVPNTQLLVASIPPSGKSDNNQRVISFNSSIPGIVDSKVAQGKKVSFVDLFSRLTPVTWRMGFIPLQMVRKIADGWYDPILNAGGDKGTLRNIENIVGSALTMY